jgi:hypothetical protein
MGCTPPLGSAGVSAPDHPVVPSGAKDLAALLLRHARPREVPMLITWIQDTKPIDVVAAIRNGPAPPAAAETVVPSAVTWNGPLTPAEKARKDTQNMP